jgi:hypothetical protein
MKILSNLRWFYQKPLVQTKKSFRKSLVPIVKGFWKR